ncbi:TetR/AcrR family transcriptional regulator [uncultured Catenibacterium sp.]|uniref:TetR/AcrR family transcriptional regulator n=2 Tax=uncultured Catenibacterium sp. TaxID=286142 RepID=UPI0025D6CB3E|nr:TetR/AcrR family transcriptional regulator [uncultured Catenibacterium sp.]
MKNDLRVVKTKENIVNNFIHLLSLYDFKDITIQMLISECKINKTTFYRHYIDKYDLIEKIQDELLEEYKQASSLFRDQLDEKAIVSLISYFNRNKEELLILNKKSLPINLFQEIYEILSNDIYVSLKKENKLMDLYSHLIANNILVTIKWCHSENDSLNDDELLKIILHTIDTGIKDTAINIMHDSNSKELID